MKYLNSDTIEKLNVQQQKIIDSTENKVVVSACPGAGKTFTIVKRIQKELIENNAYTGVIACSFTNEASIELKKRIEKKADISNSFVGTIDSFILAEIIQVFINRYLKMTYKNYKKTKIEKVVFPSNDKIKEVNELTRYINKTTERNQYCIEWFKKLYNGSYEVSFPSYIFAKKIIESDLFSELYTQKYSTIYVDEAQDLNYDQHQFIKALVSKTGINIVMVGDPNQSIYQFRGAQPNLFIDLENQGFKKYTIDINVRCHPSISYYSQKLLSNVNYDLDGIENKVLFIEKLSLDFIKELQTGLFIICEQKKTAEKFYKKLKNEFDIYYVQALDIDCEDYRSNRDILEEIIKYYYNHENPIPKHIYLDNDFLCLLKNSNHRLSIRDIKVDSMNVSQYLSYISNLIGIDLSADTISAITKLLENDVHRYFYQLTDRNNRIMTIHASKGLENKNVILVLENQYYYNLEYKNKLFVAFTRAIDNLYLCSMPNFAHKDKIDNILKGN